MTAKLKEFKSSVPLSSGSFNKFNYPLYSDPGDRGKDTMEGKKSEYVVVDKYKSSQDNSYPKKLKIFKDILSHYSNPDFSQYDPYFWGLVNGLIVANNIFNDSDIKEYLLQPHIWGCHLNISAQEKREKALQTFPDISQFIKGE